MENYTSDSSDSDSNGRTLDLSYLMLNDEALGELLANTKWPEHVDTLLLNRNDLGTLPSSVCRFTSLTYLNISNCDLTRLPDFWTNCPLTCLIAKHNHISNDGLAKAFDNLGSLRELNLSGNWLVDFPDQILDLTDLKYLFLGCNAINEITKDIWKLQR